MRLAESHIVPINVESIRLSDYAKEIFEAIPSRKGMKKAIDKGYVFVNGEQSSTGRYIKSGDRIDLYLPDDFKKSYELKIKVVYEDNEIAVVNKPAGLLTNGNAFKTLENTLSFNLSKSSASDALLWPQVTHRLDFPTSGLVIVAKTRSANTAIKKMFENRNVSKTYYAITIGNMTEKSGTIHDEVDSKPATSKYVIELTVPSNKYEAINLIKLKPVTGRRHQLRKHLAAIDFPILGDREYGSSIHWNMGRGLYLAATSIAFKHPTTNEEVEFSINLPKKFLKVLKNNQNPKLSPTNTSMPA